MPSVDPGPADNDDQLGDPFKSAPSVDQSFGSAGKDSGVAEGGAKDNGDKSGENKGKGKEKEQAAGN